jgi:hypothetical protein
MPNARADLRKRASPRRLQKPWYVFGLTELFEHGFPIVPQTVLVSF